MNDPATFLTQLYVVVDECIAQLPPRRPRPGPVSGLCPSEIVTLALFSQWGRYASERDFYRYADACLRPLFPRLPSRTQLNRLIRREQPTITHVAHALADRLGRTNAPVELLDGTGLPTRDTKRRGVGWLSGTADLGYSTRLGFYTGIRLLLATVRCGVITGWGTGPASSNDRSLAEIFFAGRADAHPALPSLGPPATHGTYAADTGFAGRACEARWTERYGVTVVCPPQSDSHRRWTKAQRRWFAGLRQPIETVFGRLVEHFRLDRDRPHTLSGFMARLAAKIALHNYCIWLNRQQGRPDLAIADVLGW